MKKHFTIEQLPEAAKIKIHDLTFDDELTSGAIGIVNLKDGFVFYDGSHIASFNSKADLLEILKDVKRE